MRCTVADRFRRELPQARVVHELVVGECRADLAIIEPSRLILVELKSRKDKLDRCEKQMRTFKGAAHHAILVADEKFFDRTPYRDGSRRCVWNYKGAFWQYGVWCWPEPQPSDPSIQYAWNIPLPDLTQPAPRVLLDLLWNAELHEECERHNIALRRRATRGVMIDWLAYTLTGAQIARAACRQLRKRSFPEADPAIVEAGDGSGSGEVKCLV